MESSDSEKYHTSICDFEQPFQLIYRLSRKVRQGHLSRMGMGWDVWVLDKCGWDLAERLERLVVNAKVATVLGWIPASSDTVESGGGRGQMKQFWITYIKKLKKIQKRSAFIYHGIFRLHRSTKDSSVMEALQNQPINTSTVLKWNLQKGEI